MPDDLEAKKIRDVAIETPTRIINPTRPQATLSTYPCRFSNIHAVSLQLLPKPFPNPWKTPGSKWSMPRSTSKPMSYPRSKCTKGSERWLDVATTFLTQFAKDRCSIQTSSVAVGLRGRLESPMLKALFSIFTIYYCPSHQAKACRIRV